MNTQDKELQLTDVLPILEQPAGSTPIIFVNPSDTLETFFTYKGRLIDLFKLKLKLKLNETSLKEVENEIRGAIEFGLKNGEWVVFNLGADPFNIKEFFSKLSFFNDEFFDNSKLLTNEYLKKHILIEIKDHFGNKGFYKVHQDGRVYYLSSCKNIEELKKENSNLKLNYYIVQ